MSPYQSELFKGFIDDLYVWKRKLTADEISKVYSNTNQFSYTWDVDSGGAPSDELYYASVAGTDKAGNAYVAGTQSITFNLDLTGPKVTSITTSSANGIYTDDDVNPSNSDTVTFTVNFDELTTIAGTPRPVSYTHLTLPTSSRV